MEQCEFVSVDEMRGSNRRKLLFFKSLSVFPSEKNSDRLDRMCIVESIRLCVTL